MSVTPADTPQRPVLLLVTADLFLGSRLRGLGEAAGYDVRMAAPSRAADALAAADRVVLDLTAPGADFTKFGSFRVAAYAPHVRVDLLKAARAAGLDAVFTRSQLEGGLPGWLRG